MSQPQDILARAALKYLSEGDRVSCGSMNLDLHLMLSGLVEITPQTTLRLTDAGRAAIATEARRAETPKSGSVHEGADPKGIAHD
jgi:hypothetical protein